MRVRVRFTKQGKVRFTSHRDVVRIVERALRRAALPMAMTEGFSPRPKLHFGLALSTGYESLAEYFDVDLRDEPGPGGQAVPVEAYPARLSALLPPGLEVTNAAVVDDREPALQHVVTSSTWRIELTDDVDPAALAASTQELLARDTVPVARERKGNIVHDDLRPNIVDIAVDGVTLTAELATQPRGVRPAELLAALDPPLPDPLVSGGRVCRTHQWIATADGAKREPLPATPAPHAEARAS